jgi:hypothetical protein
MRFSFIVRFNSNLRDYANKNFAKYSLPKIFEPPFGLTPKILPCSLRLTEKEHFQQNNKNNETSHRPTYVKRARLKKIENYLKRNEVIRLW